MLNTDPDTLITQFGYAQHAGISKQAVTKLVKAGKIRLHGKRGRIDPAEADLAHGHKGSAAGIFHVSRLPTNRRGPPLSFVSGGCHRWRASLAR